ncbi:MAG: hypothetical protein R6U32_06670 [Candidatus Woesearchaeota archaeon]
MIAGDKEGLESLVDSLGFREYRPEEIHTMGKWIEEGLKIKYNLQENNLFQLMKHKKDLMHSMAFDSPFLF